MPEIFEKTCSLLTKMSNNCRRPISVYRLPNGQTFTIDVYYDEETGIYFCLSKGRILDSINLYVYLLSRTFRFYCIKDFPKKGLFKKWLPGENKHYSGQEAEQINQARRILNLFLKFLEDPGLVRVDPYQHETILSDEETEVDLLLSTNCAVVEAFEQKLKLTKLKPGIINPNDIPEMIN